MDRSLCEGCPIGGGSAGSRGPEDAKVCIVGEAPGANELRQGIPFIGPAGQLLSKTLTRAHIDESGVFITNALRCRPPVGKPPDRKLLEACQSRLYEEVTRYPRDLVIAFGNSALRALTKNYDAKITQERGRVRPLDIGDHHYEYLLPALHPAAVLRSPGELPRLLEDVRYAASLVQGAEAKSAGEIEWVEATRDNYRDLIDLALASSQYLACDIETTDLNPRRDKTRCLSVAYAKNKAIVFPGSLMRKFPGPFHRFFGAKDHQFIWHNGKYDASFLRRLGLPVRVDQDTMLLHYLLSEGNRELHGLKVLAADLLGADPDYDAEVSQYRPFNSKALKQAPREILYPYAAMDADHTFQLFEQFWPTMCKPENANLKWLYDNLIMPASTFLQDVEAKGIWIHKPTLDSLARELQKLLAAGEKVIEAEALPVWDPKRYAEWKGANKVPAFFNPGSPYQLMWVLNQFGFHPRDPRTKKPSTNVEALKDLPQTPFVEALRSYRKLDKLYGTYVDGVLERIDGDERVHATFLIHGTATGRLASREPNMQNVPRPPEKGNPLPNIRNMFQAPPGWAFVELDYSQVELRVLAYLSGDRGLWNIYETGRDLHDEVATSLFGPNFTKEQRIRAKFVNFGIAYGRGAESLQAEFKMQRHEAQSIINGWWATFPQAHKFILETRAASRSGRPLETPLGRRRRFGLITNANRNSSENEAANFPIQATASDLTMLSAMRMHPYLRPTFDAYIINLVHDSILIECPATAATQVAAYAKEVMTALPGELLETTLPFDVSSAVAQRWGDLK